MQFRRLEILEVRFNPSNMEFVYIQQNKAAARAFQSIREYDILLEKLFTIVEGPGDTLDSALQPGRTLASRADDLRSSADPFLRQYVCLKREL